MVRKTTTDSNGNWSLTDVFPGTYTVEFFHDSRTVWANGTLDSSKADPVVVGSGTTTTLNATFPPESALYVFATLDGAPLTVFCATIKTERSCAADNGWAKFQFLVPGTYEVTVEVDGHAPATGTVTLADKTISTVTVAVT